MDSPQYSEYLNTAEAIINTHSFKPYYKWIVLNTLENVGLKKYF